MSDNLLKFSAELDLDRLLAGQARSGLSCHVKIEPDLKTGDGKEIVTTASICLVFDCSYSMAGRKFETAIKTAKMIVDILNERHWISLVAFQSKSYIVFKNEVAGEKEKDSIKSQIDILDSHLGGSTNMAAGIESGADVILEGTADANVIVLLSDGEPDSVKRAQKAADAASQKGVQLFAVGIGDSYNADQLLRVVTPSNGAVFGDREGDKISEIFYEIIMRIDRIFASNVKLNFTFADMVDLKQVFKTSPERALYDSTKIDSRAGLELRVGNIENNKVYEYLLQIDVAGQEACEKALIVATLDYDINHLGVKLHQEQEIILSVEFTDESLLQTDPDIKIQNAIKSATMVQLSDDLVKACAKPDNVEALKVLGELEKKCDEENNPALQIHLDNIKGQIENGRKISAKDRNDFLLASTLAPSRASLFDLVLVDPGSEPIRLLREIRYATSMGFREIKNIIQSRNSVVSVFKSEGSAKKLQKRLVKIGADTIIHPREEDKEETDSISG